MAKEDTNKEVTLSANDLTTLIATAVKTAVEEAKKPYISETDIKKMEQEQADRLQQANLMKQMAENVKAMQKNCLHEARDGHSHCVFVQDELGGFILCQKCQVVIRPGVTPENYKGTAVYNTDMFNRLFQRSSGSGMWE